MSMISTEAVVNMAEVVIAAWRGRSLPLFEESNRLELINFLLNAEGTPAAPEPAPEHVPEPAQEPVLEPAQEPQPSQEPAPQPVDVEVPICADNIIEVDAELPDLVPPVFTCGCCLNNIERSTCFYATRQSMYFPCNHPLCDPCYGSLLSTDCPQCRTNLPFKVLTEAQLLDLERFNQERDDEEAERADIDTDSSDGDTVYTMRDAVFAAFFPRRREAPTTQSTTPPAQPQNFSLLYGRTRRRRIGQNWMTYAAATRASNGGYMPVRGAGTFIVQSMRELIDDLYRKPVPVLRALWRNAMRRREMVDELIVKLIVCSVYVQSNYGAEDQPFIASLKRRFTQLNKLGLCGFCKMRFVVEGDMHEYNCNCRATVCKRCDVIYTIACNRHSTTMRMNTCPVPHSWN